jgi:C1A family cysteine protease
MDMISSGSADVELELEVAAPPVALEESTEIPATGWLRDWPDYRDYVAEDEPVLAQLAKADVADAVTAPPPRVDLRPWFPAVENQGSIGSCTANAGAGVVEYFERRAHGRHLDASRLFLYKSTRNLLGWTGDTGAFLRTTMAALRLFGVPPESYWPYRVADYDNEPSAFCYAFAQNYQAITYYRLDPAGTSRAAVLERIKGNLAAGLPSMFGFTVYASMTQAGSSGKIPIPAPGEATRGGHAVVAAGYDDTIKIKNMPGGPETTGAFLIRNSWGTGWGQRGYGWLPYEYVTRGLAVDWWSLVKAEWLDTGEFGL